MTLDEAVKLTAENKILKRRVKVLENILNSTLHRLAESAAEYKVLSTEEADT